MRSNGEAENMSKVGHLLDYGEKKRITTEGQVKVFYGLQEKRLFDACEEGQLHAVKHLVEKKGARVDAQDSQGRSAIFKAAKAHHAQIIDYVKGVDVNKANDFGVTPLAIAVYNVPEKKKAKKDDKKNEDKKKEKDSKKPASDKEMAEDEKKKKEEEKKTQKEFEEALEKQAKAVEALLKKGADVEAVAGKDVKKRALHIAAQTGVIRVVRVLLNKGNANPNAQDSLGRTPLHYAAEGDHYDIVEALLAADADVNVVNTDGVSPLWIVGGAKTASLLIKHGADVKKLSANSQRPLHAAAVFGQLDVVKTLVEEADASLDDVDDEGNTPIDLARANDHMDIVEYLRWRSEFSKLLARVEALEKKSLICKSNST